ncbi:hypothetical protein [Fusobacterium vincentii]|uniref:hypothetical protein n=1 Tax=Fusobacterium vincentii TaxID=155615 RepID=UPI0030CBBFCB
MGMILVKRFRAKEGVDSDYNSTNAQSHEYNSILKLKDYIPERNPELEMSSRESFKTYRL